MNNNGLVAKHQGEAPAEEDQCQQVSLALENYREKYSEVNRWIERKIRIDKIVYVEELAK